TFISGSLRCNEGCSLLSARAGSDTAVVAARDFLPRCAIAFFLFFWTFLKRKLVARSFYDCRQSFTPPPTLSG
ncbi:TPA: hypothetical protein ACR6PB_003612, partial [Klebsiella pneumoniae]